MTSQQTEILQVSSHFYSSATSSEKPKITQKIVFILFIRKHSTKNIFISDIFRHPREISEIRFEHRFKRTSSIVVLLLTNRNFHKWKSNARGSFLRMPKFHSERRVYILFQLIFIFLLFRLRLFLIHRQKKRLKCFRKFFLSFCSFIYSSILL